MGGNFNLAAEQKLFTFWVGRMLFRKMFVGIIIFSLLSGTAAWGNGLVGLWVTEGGKSHIKIALCGIKLCGRIVWLKEPLAEDGKIKYDVNNPDKELRQRSIIGLHLLEGFVASAEVDVWENGTIYNPEDGKTYSCTLTLLNFDTLKVRGYVGLPLFGKTQIWKRVT